MKLSDNQKRVLKFFQEQGDDICFFDYVCKNTGLDKRIVRISCRALFRKGLLKYTTAWDDWENCPSGSGYSITEYGKFFNFSK